MFLLQALSSDADVIVSALRKSTSGVLEVNLEGDSVRRSPDNPPPDIFSAEQRKKMKEKTVYVVNGDFYNLFLFLVLISY